jgi:hypothetical protein
MRAVGGFSMLWMRKSRPRYATSVYSWITPRRELLRRRRGDNSGMGRKSV